MKYPKAPARLWYAKDGNGNYFAYHTKAKRDAAGLEKVSACEIKKFKYPQFLSCFDGALHFSHYEIRGLL